MREISIEGVCLSEFNEKAGFQLITNLPECSPLTEPQFRLYSELMLPKEAFCDRLLTIEYLEQYFLLGVPSLSLNKGEATIYSRNCYIYNVTIIVKKQIYFLHSAMFKKLSRQIAVFFKEIEEAHHVIYNNLENKEYLTNTLQSIYNQVNTQAICELSYLCTHYAFINLHMPFSISSINILLPSSLLYCNLTPFELNQISSSFGKKLMEDASKGVFTFAKICLMHPNFKSSVIKEFYETAIQKGVVHILSLFTLRNIYVLTEKIMEYLPNGNSFEKMIDITNAVKKETDVTVEQILDVYLKFKRIMRINKLIEENANIFNKISIFKLERLGLLHGIIKRVHEKIVYTQEPRQLIYLDELTKFCKDNKEMNIKIKAINEHLRKKDNIDEMVCNLEIESENILKILSSENRIILKVTEQS